LQRKTIPEFDTIASKVTVAREGIISKEARLPNG
jgi:hypothetical protein